MTEVIYLEVSEKAEAAKKAGRRVSVSGMLKFLGVSRSGYLACLHHVPSDTEKRRKAVNEYSGAAEPPFRCGVSHLSGMS